MRRYSYLNWSPYVPVFQRRRQAARRVARMQKDGHTVSPVEIAGRRIATTFWGDAWCKNLEAYSDYANRLPRGRTYVRNGSVIDLRIEAGCVRSLVSGSAIYEVDIQIQRLAKKHWADIKSRCAGRIDSLVELLRGSISKGVMEMVSRKGDGLFPAPREISVNCSCPDWATMCKHVAATLYGVGARLDHAPEMLFALRGVDPSEMVEAVIDQPPVRGTSPKQRVLRPDQLSALFGVEIDVGGGRDGGKAVPGRAVPGRAVPGRSGRRAARGKKKTGKRSLAAKKLAARKPAARKARAGKATAKKAAARKPHARKAVAKTLAASSAALKKAAAPRKSAGRASQARKKTAARRPAPRRGSRTRNSAAGKVSKRARTTRTKTERDRTKRAAPVAPGTTRRS